MEIDTQVWLSNLPGMDKEVKYSLKLIVDLQILNHALSDFLTANKKPGIIFIDEGHVLVDKTTDDSNKQ